MVPRNDTTAVLGSSMYWPTNPAVFFSLSYRYMVVLNDGVLPQASQLQSCTDCWEQYLRTPPPQHTQYTQHTQCRWSGTSSQARNNAGVGPCNARCCSHVCHLQRERLVVRFGRGTRHTQQEDNSNYTKNMTTRRMRHSGSTTRGVSCGRCAAAVVDPNVTLALQIPCVNWRDLKLLSAWSFSSCRQETSCLASRVPVTWLTSNQR